MMQPEDNRVAPGCAPTVAVAFVSSADGTVQPARFLCPSGTGPAPLVVGLHTWSADWRQRGMPQIEAWCAARGWAYIHPDFRGPSWSPQAAGSDLVVSDLLDAVRFVQREVPVDPRRIFLVGASGGGYHALLMAGRAPAVWAGVSAWVPISDLEAWHRECRAAGLGYAGHIEASCGGPPGASAEVGRQLRLRSPLTWLHQAGGVPLDIHAGIHDGHQGSVPVSHALRAFNAVAAPDRRVAEADIGFMVEREEIPGHLRQEAEPDVGYGDHRVLFRRVSGLARVTVFAGGHEMIESAVLAWLGARCPG